jgi:hypothetical protein
MIVLGAIADSSTPGLYCLAAYDTREESITLASD